MANWIPISYALTGSKEELQDLERKIRATEDEARKKADDSQELVDQMCDITYLAQLLGSSLTYADLGSYWYYAKDDYDALEWKTTDDGGGYLLWDITNKHWENPKLREMIENAYKGIKVYYDAPAGDTNDKEHRYFQPLERLTNIDGLNYALNDDGTAMLNADDSIKGKVLRVPEQVECNGKNYIVTRFGDYFADPEFGSSTEPPKELEEIFFPATIKEITANNITIPTLKAIHFAGDIDSIGEYAFYGCTQLSIVEFGGKVGRINSNAFAYNDIKDIEIPDGTRVVPDAFEHTSFGNKKSLVIGITDAQKLSGCVQLLREMQYRMDIRIVIGDPYLSSYSGAVVYDKCQATLNDQLCWIYDNLGDELLRNTVIGDCDAINGIKSQADVRLTYYDHLNEISTSVHVDDEVRMNEDFHSVEELKTFLLNLDSNIEEFKEKLRNNPEECDMPF